MSMELTTVTEIIQVFFVYFLCFFLVPHMVMKKHMIGKPLAERFLLCLVVSNGYIIVIVFILFLLPLPKTRLFFRLFTVIPAFIIWQRINRPNIRRFFVEISIAFSRLMLGEAKIKTLWNTFSETPKQMRKELFRTILSHFWLHIVEWLIFLSLMIFNLWYHSYGAIHKYIYGTSDIVVHHSWIHQMDSGVIFFKGIYPFGYHNIVFFLHQFFHLRIMSILRVFGPIQALLIYCMIYLMLRKICHSRFVPLLGLFLFTLPDLYDFQGTMRYQWSLPQEYAMLFLYPCAYFLIQYFERKKEEISTEKQMMEKKLLYAWLPKYHLLPSTKSLMLFGTCFALTLSIHFYITIIACFLCLAVAIAYFPVVFHYRYFFSIALAGLLSVLTAVTPLFIGYMEGHGLEGSLIWALSAMSPNPGSTSQKGSNSEKNTSDTEIKEDSSDTETSSQTSSSSQGQNIHRENPLLKIGKGLVAITLAVKNLPQTIWKALNQYNQVALADMMFVYTEKRYILFTLWAMDGIILTGFVLGILSRKYYCRNMIAMGLFYLFMTLLVTGSYYSLPALMDYARSRLFIAYATPVVLACAVDFVYSICFLPLHYHKATEFAPIGLTALLTWMTISNGKVKPLNIIYALQEPGEMYCNYQIMKEYPKATWTLVTTTNSLELVSDDGWMVELADFLKSIEHYDQNSKYTIPSKYLFFYIEKYPLSYAGNNAVNQALANLGRVSEEAAAMPAQYAGGGVYSGGNRYILESKFFYWAKAFEAKYPKEFQVFYEDDDFICYRLVQNEYQLYNLAIDYGFNTQ